VKKGPEVDCANVFSEVLAAQGAFGLASETLRATIQVEEVVRVACKDDDSI